MKIKINKDTLLFPLIFLLIFYAIAIWRYTATGKTFYIWNFGYLGTALALGIFLSGALPKKQMKYARMAVQLLIGSYLLVYVGLICMENLQIEGFWVYLFLGVFAGATLHYLIAKIIGTVIFNRGWCGWACWTAMILDLLPWSKPQKAVNPRWTHLRYFHFYAVLAGAVFLFFYTGIWADFQKQNVVELTWLIIGNTAYYAIGISLAYILKDNRAFCKYVCPIPVFQKFGAKYALIKMKIDQNRCIDCTQCEKHCPMQIQLLEYKNKGERILSTECILCQSCAAACPKDAISMTLKMDGMRKANAPGMKRIC